VSVTTLSVLRLLRWAVLALALSWVFAAAAQDQRPLDLDATRNALTGIENTLKQPNLTDADLLRLRAENDPLGVALQAAIADLTPRLAASVKRLAELTPKLEKLFAGWKSGGIPVKNVSAVKLPPKPAVYIVDKPGAEQSPPAAQGLPGNPCINGSAYERRKLTWLAQDRA